MKTLLHGLLGLAALSPLVAAQSSLTPHGTELDSSLTEWRAKNGDSWRLRAGAPGGHASFLYGGSAAPASAPRTDAQWVDVARDFLTELEPMHGTPNGELRLKEVTLLPLGISGGTDKMAVAFVQEVGGVPVHTGTVDLLMDMDGRLLSLHNQAQPGISGISTQPTVSAGTASETAIEAFGKSHGIPTYVHPVELALVPLERSEQPEVRLAWRIEISKDDPGTTPAGEIVTVDAQDGTILDRVTTVHNFDVHGQITSMASPGVYPDTASYPEVQIPMPYIRITSSAGTVFADIDGNFNFPGVNSPLDITVEYRGTYNNVDNQAGADYSLMQTIQPNTATTVLMNPVPNQHRTAQANGYLHINTVGEFIRNTTPGDTTADFLATTNPNRNSTCNANFNGVATNYYLAGGGCPNTCYSSVIAHEFGHWLNLLYGTGNGPDGMGEGNADVFAMYVFDDPVMGRDFFGSGSDGRNGNNTRQYCGDGNGGCYGQVHSDGEVWMGAAWKVRRNLKTSLGDAPGGAVANSIFMGWLNAYNQTQIDSIIELQWLTLDDDDGDLINGTPNFFDIDGAFREQGFPGIVLPAALFSNVTTLPDSVNPGPFTVDATVLPNHAAGITGVDLYWREEAGTFASLPMAPQGGDVYSVQIPATASPNLIQYYLEASNTNSDIGTFPEGAPADAIAFGVGSITSIFAYDFEPAIGDDEGWVSGDMADTATSGFWERGDPNGTPAQPENDISNPGTRCWFTGQAPVGGTVGENDVDGGTTTLTSPVFDATGIAGASISYWRWFSNSVGSSASEDELHVEISNDGGSSFILVEQVGPDDEYSNGGWFFHDFVVSDFVTPTSTMLLRFRASDEGGGSIVEAAIDELVGVGFGLPCPSPTNYCTNSANSTGNASSIGNSGGLSVASNDLVLTADNLPVGTSLLFFYSDTQTNVVFGNGTRCVGGSIQRLPVVVADGAGNASYSLDLTALLGANPIDAGDTVNFQGWYRDTAGGGSLFNLTDGLSGTFCP